MDEEIGKLNKNIMNYYKSLLFLIILKYTDKIQL